MASPSRGKAIGSPTELADPKQVRQFLALVADPLANVELRGLPSGRSRVRPGNDLHALVEAAEQLSGDRGVYYTLNPVCPLSLPAGADRAAKVGDILWRRWLLIDVDPERPAGTNATDEEKAWARGVVDSVRDWLCLMGWPSPVEVDSGNGYHLLYRIDLPCNDESQALLRAVLHTLSDLHDCEAVVDRQVHNASRIAKLPGTWARKGPHSQTHPHRPARLLHAPGEVQVVTVDQLRGVASTPIVSPDAETVVEDAPLPKKPGKNPFHGKATSSKGPSIDERAIAYLASCPPAIDGQGGSKTTMSVARSILWGFSLSVDHAFDLLWSHYNPRCQGPWSEKDLRRKCEQVEGTPDPKGRPRGYLADQPNPRWDGPTPHTTRQSHASADTPPADTPIIVRASQVEPRQLAWLWPGRLPTGKLVTFAGPGGTGKTFALLDISARITRGADWPDGQPGGDPKSVLFISSEDDPADTLVPRLIEVEADLQRVGFLVAEVNASWCLQRMDTLRRAIAELGDVGMIVIDPPTSYLGGADDHKNSELRQVLHPLSLLAGEVGCTIVLNTHVNKGTSSDLSAAGRIMGSVAWVNAVRAAYLLVRDPDDSSGERRLFAQVKCNLAREPATLAYRIVPSGSMARVEWLGVVNTTADQAVGNRPAQRRQHKAREWLIEQFRKKRRWLSTDLLDEARKAGISRDGLYEAAKILTPPPVRQQINVPDERGGNQRCWVWTVPNDWSPLSDEEAAWEA
ncbi:MAG: AAA family ATPase [Gemmataceae bacterium]